MKAKTWIGIFAVLMVVILMTGAFSGGFIAGRYMAPETASYQPVNESSEQTNETEQPETKEQVTEQATEPVDIDELFKPFWQAWDVVHDRFVDQPVDDVVLMRGAISGMLDALGDEHTSYLDPEMAKQFSQELNGEEYEGIGAWVDISGDYLEIISPMPGSPAEKAGLKSGDKVIAINGEDMTGVDGEMARQRILGKAGTTVTLTIQRKGQEEPMDVVVERAAIIVPTINAKMLENDIAYVQLYTFGDTTAEDLHNALKDLMEQNPKGLILDLRNNGGGYLQTAIQVASEFIGDGVIMYEEYGDGSRDTYKARPGGLATDIPMVVLINEGSASASEIVAGAIQDRQRGSLAGVTSFGKGSVQTVEQLVNDQGQVRVTIARWLTPGERQIHKLGLTPDYVVEITDADREADLDPQLQKAIELLMGG